MQFSKLFEIKEKMRKIIAKKRGYSTQRNNIIAGKVKLNVTKNDEMEEQLYDLIKGQNKIIYTRPIDITVIKPYKNNLCIIVIPIYKPFHKLSAFEKLSLKQVFKILKKYDILFFYPKNLNIDNYLKIYNTALVLPLDEKWFNSNKTYSDLCEENFFYNFFIKYQFMLIYQLDAFVFKDELQLWCEKNYDYIGAPHYLMEIHKWAVGNGGFSLRKISKFMELTKKENIYKNDSFYLEDRYFCEKCGNINLPKLSEAFKFASIEYDLKIMEDMGLDIYYDIKTFGMHNNKKIINKILNKL